MQSDNLDFKINERVTRVNYNILINFTMTVIWSVFELTPYLSRNTSGTIKLVIFGAWFFSLFFIADIRRVINHKFFILPVVIIIYQSILLLVGASNVSLLSLIDRWRLYFIPLGMLISLNAYGANKCGSLARVIGVVFIANLLSNIFLYATGTVRNDISLGDAVLGASARLTNAGETSFCFLVSIFVLFSIYLITNHDKKQKKLGVVILFLSIWYLFFLNSRAISIMILLICTYLYICQMFISNRKNINMGFRFIIVVFLSFVLLYNISFILNLLGTVKGNDWMGEKMRDLNRLITGGGIGTYGSLSIRFTLYGYAISTWLKTPFSFVFGIGEQAYATASRYYLQIAGISGHSDIFDEAAQYGIIGLILMFKLYYGAFGEVKKNTNNNRLKALISVVTVMFFMYGFFNHFTFGNILFTIFMFIPMYIKSNQQNGEV